MFWLAGLLGIVAAGAASLLVAPFVEGEDDAEPAAISDDIETPTGDLLDEVKTLSSMSTANSGNLLRSIALDPTGSEAVDLDPTPETDRTVGDDFGGPTKQHRDDQIMLGDWITKGHPAEVLDYEPAKDSLMLVWDDLARTADEPDVTVESDPFDAEVMHILMNCKSVAEIYGDPELTVADITLIPLSSALIVGLEPA